MNVLINSFKNWFEEKTTSPLYGVFLTSFILWNWKIFYILFFENQSMFSLSRMEYIQQNLFWQGGFLMYIANLIWIFLAPVGIAYAVIRYMPILHRWAYKWKMEAYFDRRSIRDRLQIEYEKKESSKLETLAKIKKEQAKSGREIQESQKNIEKSMTDGEKWDVEFEGIQNSQNVNTLSEIVNAIYANGGSMWSGPGIKISKKALAFADSNGLISISDNKIAPTEKGRFFIKKYLEKSGLA